MPAVNFTSLQKDITHKKFVPVYVLQGDEPYYVDEICDFMCTNIIDEMLLEFNQTILYGRDVDALQIVSQAKRYPVMSDFQLVMIKEAQDVKSWKKEEDYEPFIQYLKNPAPTTILVLAFKSKGIDKRTRLFKAINSVATIMESNKLKDEMIPAWIVDYLSSKKVKIKTDATQLLAESLGNDLSKVANELGKLLINFKQGEEITLDHIEKNIGISKDFNVFELQKAIGQRNVYKANLIARYFGSNPRSNPLVVTLGSLHSFFSKLLIFHSMKGRQTNEIASAMGVSPYFMDEYNVAARNYNTSKLIDIASLIRTCDLRSKGINNTSTSEGELLKELVYKILH